VSADDFKRGIERSLKPASGSKLAPLLKGIESVQVKTPDELLIRLKHPISAFLEILTLPITYPIHAQDLTGVWNPLQNKRLHTNGAYQVVEYLQNQKIILQSRLTSNTLAPKTVEIKMVSDESTALSLFEQGKLDLLTKIPSYDFERLKRSERLSLYPFYATYFISFNLKKVPLALRRSIARAIDKDELVKVLATGESPSNSWISQGLEGALPYEKSKIQRTEVRMKIEGTYDSSSRNSLVMEKIQSDLKKNIGLELQLRAMDWKSFVSHIFSSPSQLYRWGWFSPIKDPLVFLLPFKSGNPFNFAGYSNPKVDRLISQIEQMGPSVQRREKIEQVQRIILDEDVVVVPLYQYHTTLLKSERIQELELTPFGYFRFDEVKFKN
jgi:ABC-type oligopeptide transport system substrate-binding subunit